MGSRPFSRRYGSARPASTPDVPRDRRRRGAKTREARLPRAPPPAAPRRRARATARDCAQPSIDGPCVGCARGHTREHRRPTGPRVTRGNPLKPVETRSAVSTADRRECATPDSVVATVSNRRGLKRLTKRKKLTNKQLLLAAAQVGPLRRNSLDERHRSCPCGRTSLDVQVDERDLSLLPGTCLATEGPHYRSSRDRTSCRVRCTRCDRAVDDRHRD